MSVHGDTGHAPHNWKMSMPSTAPSPHAPVFEAKPVIWVHVPGLRATDPELGHCLAMVRATLEACLGSIRGQLLRYCNIVARSLVQ